MRRAFTLMEVNLAMMIMAGGILSLVALYSFGFRENRQSREDVAAAAYAESVVSPLVMAISATNLKWSTFSSLGSYPGADGWGEYLDQTSGRIRTDIDIESVFNGAMNAFAGCAAGGNTVRFAFPSEAKGDLKGGLIVLHESDSAVVRIGFRAASDWQQLLTAPLYYTEVRFQGVIDQ